MLLDKEPSKESVDQLKEKLAFLNTFIGDQKYLTGDHVTLADYAIFITAIHLEKMNFDLTENPNIKKCIKTLSTEHPDVIKVASNFDGIDKVKEMVKKKMGLK